MQKMQTLNKALKPGLLSVWTTWAEVKGYPLDIITRSCELSRTL